MFQDEGRFGRISDPHRCWAPKGVRPNISAQMVREYTYAFAAVSPCDGIMDSLILPEVNAQMMSIFLTEVSIRHRDEYIIMVMDQAGWHKAKDLIIPENMRLVWLPPYSPQCNPVEHIWDEIREKYFVNLVFEDMNAVENTLADALISLEMDQKKVFGLTSFEWIINISLNAT